MTQRIQYVCWLCLYFRIVQVYIRTVPTTEVSGDNHQNGNTLITMPGFRGVPQPQLLAFVWLSIARSLSPLQYCSVAKRSGTQCRGLGFLFRYSTCRAGSGALVADVKADSGSWLIAIRQIWSHFYGLQIYGGECDRFSAAAWQQKVEDPFDHGNWHS